MEQLDSYLEPSQLLDYNHPAIQKLIKSKGWDTIKVEATLIGEIYTFVRDEIAYGYTRSFYLPASQILSKGYGTYITKSTLLMALLRAVGVPCRFHSFTISKVILRGLLPSLMYKLVSQHPYHAWVDVNFNNKWITIDGHTIDKPYLMKLQEKFPDYMGSFYGYGMAVLHFKNTENRWDDERIYAYNQAIEEDLGLFDTPDAFFAKYPKVLSYTHSFRYSVLFRSQLNKNIMAVRDSR
ncbi:MAG TPA: transglutaminase-like domain-containing protein [Sphaerochaeta sp.]|nr:transglutaminase-like domain-containing protein [Sphaerochaeta sp.]